MNTLRNYQNLIAKKTRKAADISFQNIAQFFCLLLIFLVSVWPYMSKGNTTEIVISWLLILIISFAFSYFREHLVQVKNKGQKILNSFSLQAQVDHFFRANENLICNCLLFLMLITAFTLRFVNLTVLDPYTDEYFHLIAVKEYITEGSFSYSRAKLVTYLAAFFSEIGGASNFNEYVYWARIPGVIFGTLTIIPVYYLAQMVSKPVALLSALLWATSPWAIGVARSVREYTYYPLIVLIIVLILIKLIDLLIHYEGEHRLKIFVYSIAIASFLIYATSYDTASTLKISIIPLFGVAVYYLMINISKVQELYIRNRPALLVFIALFLATVASIILYGYNVSQVTYVDIDYPSFWLEYYFLSEISGAPIHWWGNKGFPLVAVLIFISGLVYAVMRKQYIYFLYFIVFFLFIIGFTYFFDLDPKPRFLFYAFPFFIPLVSIGVFALIGHIQNISKSNFLKMMGSLIIIIFICQCFILQNPLHRIVRDEYGHVKTTGQFHYSLESTKQLLEDELTEEYAFIVTWPARGLLFLEFDIKPDDVYIYWWKEPDRFDMVESIVEENPQGLMILDSFRNGIWARGYPREGSFQIGNTKVEVLQNKDGMTVYRW